MSDNNNEFLKNADVRAGRIPGWRSKPETNGDPYDPNNLERTDASMVVTDGMILRNIASMNAAPIVGQRWLLAKAIGIATFGFAAYWLYSHYGPAGIPAGLTASTSQAATHAPRSQQYQGESGIIGNSSAPREEDAGSSSTSAGESEPSKPGKTPDYVTASQYIEKFYTKATDGVSKKYDTKFFSKFGWPVKGYDWSINAYSWNKFNAMYKSGDLKSTNDQVPAFCAGLTLAECLPKMQDQMAFAALAYAGENMDMYGNRGDSMDDTQKPVEKLETALSNFTTAFSERKAALEKEGQPMPNYCDSANRRYADTWGVQQASANLRLLQQSWETDGKIKYNDHIVEVGSMKELIALREDGDKKCNNINIAVLHVGSGALEYIVNVSVRTHNSNGDNIATGMYLLGQLDKGRVISLIATNNSDNAPIFSQQVANSNQSSILPGLNIASSKIVSLFEKSDYSLVDKNNSKTTQGE